MSSPLHATAIFLSGALRLGPLLVSMYGLFAAIGMIAALLLTQRTAAFAGLPSQQLWNASLFAITAAFVVSRVLLIVRDPHAFMTLPLVVLALPSFTYLGMVLTALALAAYLKWKRQRLLSVLDAWAPCAALLAVLLSLGHFFEGTDAGMPTSLPWGTVVPGSGGLHLQPVQIYAAVASLGLFVVLLRLLQRRARAGVTASVALVSGGAVVYLLDMLTQPSESSSTAWLDPAQWIALGAMVAGVSMLLVLKEIV